MDITMDNSLRKVALITGITGQDGSYLAELLLEKGYIVWGIIRRSSSINTRLIDYIFDKLTLRYGDLTDSSNIFNILTEIKNKHFLKDFVREEEDNLGCNRLEVYNLGAMSHVKISFELPEYTCDVDAMGTLRLLEACRTCGIPLQRLRFYQASTSEMFGKVMEVPQTEKTPFYPRSPYGVAKLYAYWITRNYREAYGMYACSGILFNHESPRRGHNFVTRKITIALGNILKGKQDKLVLGNINSLRDWGHAKDYVNGMWLMLQKDDQMAADDYVLSTNEYHSVREFVEKAFLLKGIRIGWKNQGLDEKGIRIGWKNQGLDEKGIDLNTGKEYIVISEKYFRPTEVDELLGDSSKARKELGWKPSINFDELVREMVEEDCL
jgi:GDPmannose 4,6-dehydratase